MPATLTNLIGLTGAAPAFRQPFSIIPRQLRDRVRADVIETLGDRDGALVVDETGFLSP